MAPKCNLISCDDTVVVMAPIHVPVSPWPRTASSVKDDIKHKRILEVSRERIWNVPQCLECSRVLLSPLLLLLTGVCCVFSAVAQFKRSAGCALYLF